METRELFKKVLQIGIVVRDLEESVRKYWHDCGIGPWLFYTMDARNMHDLKVNGKPAEFSMKVAMADLAGIQLELIEPLDENIYSEFLNEHGEGIHHIACDVDDFDRTISVCKEKGIPVLQEGETNAGLGFAYLDTRKTMACITEIYKIPAGIAYPPPERTYP